METIESVDIIGKPITLTDSLMYLSKIQIGWDTVNIRLHTGFDKGFFYFEKWEDGSRIGMSSPDIDLSSFFLVNQNEELIKWLNELPQWTRI